MLWGTDHLQTSHTRRRFPHIAPPSSIFSTSQERRTCQLTQSSTDMPQSRKKRRTLKTLRTHRWPHTHGTPRTLLDLPTELHLYILEAAHDSNDLFSLILTAPNFASVWKLHAASVSAKVLARSIECYPSAIQLDLDIYPLTQQPGFASDLNVASDFYETVQSHRRILEVDRCVNAFHTLFVEDCTRDNWGSYHYESSSEESQRKRALCYVWRLVKTSIYGRQKAGHCPISLPPHLNNPELSDTLATVEIISWVYWVYYDDCSSIHLERLILEAYKIYGPTDKVRCAQLRRWIECCNALWRADAHRLLRQKYWDAIGLKQAEPPWLRWLCQRRREFLAEANGALRTSSCLLF